MMKKFSAVVAVFISVMLLAACNNDKDEKTKDSKNDKVVATVNGVEIPRSDYNLLLDEMKATYEMQGITEENMDEATKKQLETSVLDQLINTELLYQQAKEEKIEVTKEDIAKSLDQMKGQFDDEKKFEEALKENKLTEDELKDRIEKDLLITRYIDKNVGEINVSDAEIQKDYDEYKKAMEAQKQEAAPLDDVKAQLKAQVASKKQQDKITLILQGLRGNSEIKTF